MWAQLAVGGALVIILITVSLSSGLYSSEWDEENSNFYPIAMQALKMSHVNPSSPTAIVFWEQNCQACKKAIQGLQSAPPSLRIYGVHLTAPSNDEVDIRQSWLQTAPGSAQLMIDQDELLQTAFHVRGVPTTFIVLPKQKKVYSFLGDISKENKRMLEIIQSEY